MYADIELRNVIFVYMYTHYSKAYYAAFCAYGYAMALRFTGIRTRPTYTPLTVVAAAISELCLSRFRLSCS